MSTGRENRSVSDFSTENSLRKALLVQDGAPKVDWVLNSIDPKTTQVQSMKEELHRLQVLKSYFRQEPDERLNRMTRMASRIFQMPMCMVSLVDLGRQWFISRHGWQEGSETPRTYSFCAHVIQSNTSEVAVVPDATQDVRFQENPLVTGPPNIRFYAGAPLLSPEGYKLGTFCVLDTQPRPEGLTKDECDTLTDFAAMTVQAMVDRRDRHQDHHREDPAKLIAYAAHDLMTPLTGVQLSLSLLAEDEEVQGKLHEHQMELLTSATNCSDLMIRICEKTMDSLRQHPSVAQLQKNAKTAAAAKEGGGATDPQQANAETEQATSTEQKEQQHQNQDELTDVMDLVDLVKSLELIMKPIPKLVPLIITLDPNIPHIIRGDDLKLFRSALNLVSCAVQRTAVGKVHVRIFAKEEMTNEQQHQNQQPQQRLVFQCQDTAEDIPVEEYQYLFQGASAGNQQQHENPLLLTLSSVASLVKTIDGGEFGFRPRSMSPDGTELTDVNGQPLKGSVFWFSVRLETLTESEEQQRCKGLKKSLSGLLRRRRGSGKSFSPMMLRCGSNSSVSLHGSFSPRVGLSASHSSLGNLTRGGGMHGSRRGRSGGGGVYEGFANAVFGDEQQKPRAAVIPREIVGRVSADSSRAGGSSSVASSSFAGTATSGLRRTASGSELRRTASGSMLGFSTSGVSLGFPTSGRTLGMRKSVPLWGLPSTSNSGGKDNSDCKPAAVEPKNDPAASVKSSPSSRASVPAKKTGPRAKRALVIEDSLVVRKSLARALSKLGFEVEQAVDGLEGLKSMKETLFDMVLCDFLMPVMDGLDCVKQYRAWEKENRPSHRQPIIGISAHVSVSDSGQGLAAGMDDFRPKPISIKTLTELQGNDAVVASSKILNGMEGDPQRSRSPSPASNNADPPQVQAVQQPGKRKSPPPPMDVVDAKRPRGPGNSEASFTAEPVCLLAMDTPTLESNEFLKIMETTGWKVVVVHDGTDAARLLQMRNWNAVLIADDIPSLPAMKCIADFRDWEEKNRVNEQRNVFLVCEGDIPSPLDKSSVVQPPSGFNGVLQKPVVWKDLDFMIQQRSKNMKIVVRR